MASFTYPQHLLHKIIEPQWFPYQKGETESILTSLEAAEEAHAQQLNAIVQNEKAVVIGLRKTSGRRRQEQQPSQSRTSEDSNTTTEHDDVSTVVAQQQPPLPQERFWNRRRSTTSTQIRD